MKVEVLSLEKSKKEKIDLPEEFFDLPLNQDLIHQVVRIQALNRRQPSAHTKDRSEVAGSGRKPWPQKYTGRARHGSIRSPIWRGGGVTFGPRVEKNYKLSLPKRMRRKALFVALSQKLRDKELILVEDFTLDKPSTKKLKEILTKILPQKYKSVLLVLPSLDYNLILSARNLPKVETIQAKDLNVLDLLSFKYVVILKSSIGIILETFNFKER